MAERDAVVKPEPDAPRIDWVLEHLHAKNGQIAALEAQAAGLRKDLRRRAREAEGLRDRVGVLEARLAEADRQAQARAAELRAEREDLQERADLGAAVGALQRLADELASAEHRKRARSGP